MNRHITAIFIAAVAAGALLQGCSHAPDPAKVKADVAKAQAEGRKTIADAQANLDKVNAQNNEDIVDAKVDARSDTANGAPANDADTPTSSSAPSAPVPPASEAVAKARTEAIQLLTPGTTWTRQKPKPPTTWHWRAAKRRPATLIEACKKSAKDKYDVDVAAAKFRNDAAYQANRKLILRPIAGSDKEPRACCAGILHASAQQFCVVFCLDANHDTRKTT